MIERSGGRGARRASKRTRVALLALAASVVCVALAEAWLRGRVPQNGLTPFRTSEIPGVCWELRRDFETRYRGIEIELNSLGFRGPELEPPMDGVRRIALVGDSMVFGNGVEFEETLGACLVRRFAQDGIRAQVLNCGVPGYNAQDVAKVLEARVVALAPDTIVYVCFANDAEPAQQVGAIPEDAVLDALAGFPLRSALLEWTQTHAKRALQRAGIRTSLRTPATSAGEFALGRAAFTGALRRMKAVCARAGIRLHVVAYPFLSPPGMNPFAPIDAAVARECRSLDLDFHRLARAFEPGEDLTRYWAGSFDMHPNGAANALVADVLVEKVLAEGPP